MGNALSAADFQDGQFICFFDDEQRAMLVHWDDNAKQWTLEPSADPADVPSKGDATRVLNGLCDSEFVVLDLAMQFCSRVPTAYILSASRVSSPKEGRRGWFSLVEVLSTIILRVLTTLTQSPVILLRTDVLQS